MSEQQSPQQPAAPQPQEKERGLIAWFANNPVAANLLMVFIIVMGLFSYSTMQRQMFPNMEINYINVNASYRGASPQEVEESILIKIEEVLKDVTEVEEMYSRAFRNGGSVSLEIDSHASLPEVMDKVKMRIDGIATFPAGMEPVRISQAEFRQQVIDLSLAGETSLTELKRIANDVEDELLQLSNVSLVNVNAPSDEISVEVQPEKLRKYNLTLNDITNAIRRYSANYSAGQLRTDSGLITVRIENQFYSGEEFRQIPVIVGENGAKVLLQDVANIEDGFTEGLRYTKLSGKNQIYIQIQATKTQDINAVADSVKKYIGMKNQSLPEGLELVVVTDSTYYLNGRLNMMLTNLLQGSILVAIMLSIFLRFRLALWVMVGLPVCFLGAMMMMPIFGITINVISLFGFIMVLGIVVDDAIVIGESAHSEVEKHGGGVDNVVRGAKRVATPATFGVLTTIAMFAPVLFTSGNMSAFITNIAGVFILCLCFSLVESKWILPAHLAHTNFSSPKIKKETYETKSRNPLILIWNLLKRFGSYIKQSYRNWRTSFNTSFKNFINNKYKPFLVKCIEWRWSVMMLFFGILLVSAALIFGNHLRVTPFPKIPHDYPSIRVEMNETVSDQQTIDTIMAIENMVRNVEREIEAETGVKMYREVLAFNRGRNEGRILVPLIDDELRPFDTFELARRWREQMPTFAGVKSITVEDQLMGGPGGGQGGGDFGFLLYGPDLDTLNTAGRQFIEMLSQMEGLFDIGSTIDPAGKEIRLELKPVAYDLGLTLQSIAGQIGASFYGGEAQRVLRNGEEVRVMVRYPQLTREKFSQLKYALVTTPQGKEVMLGDVVELREMPGLSYISRENGNRSVYIYGSIDEVQVESSAVIGRVYDELLPALIKDYPLIKTEIGGSFEEEQAQQNEMLLFMVAGFLLIYILLAIPLKSYAQPFIIMSVIPYGFVGAAWGHVLFDMDLSMMSLYGFLAAAGVVINDSLVMTDFVNQARERGMSIRQAVIDAGCVRFRAIILTSITTFAGVVPIMFESSLQAMFVVPMAVALGFAVLFATFITLLLVPCLYMVLEDFKGIFSRKKAQQVEHSVDGENSIMRAMKERSAD